MDMSRFWSKVPSECHVPASQIQNELAYAAEWDWPEEGWQYAIAKHPTSGPAGRYRNPSVELMAYNADIDELWVFYPEEGNKPADWLLWNY